MSGMTSWGTGRVNSPKCANTSVPPRSLLSVTDCVGVSDSSVSTDLTRIILQLNISQSSQTLILVDSLVLN